MIHFCKMMGAILRDALLGAIGLREKMRLPMSATWYDYWNLTN